MQQRPRVVSPNTQIGFLPPTHISLLLSDLLPLQTMPLALQLVLCEATAMVAQARKGWCLMPCWSACWFQRFRYSRRVRCVVTSKF